jgi:hypothetical protein
MENVWVIEQRIGLWSFCELALFGFWSWVLHVAVGSVHISPINGYEFFINPWPQTDTDETARFEGMSFC